MQVVVGVGMSGGRRRRRRRGDGRLVEEEGELDSEMGLGMEVGEGRMPSAVQHKVVPQRLQVEPHELPSSTARGMGMATLS